MDLNGDQPPLLWPELQTSVALRRRSPLSPFFTPPVLIIILPAMVLLLLFFVVPSFLSITSQILRPNSVRKSWDSLNVFLVLFAILCGVFARRNEDGSSQPPSPCGEDSRSVTHAMVNAGEDSKPLSASQLWLGDLYAVDSLKIHESVTSGTPPASLPAPGTGRLRRTSSSYPDLRQACDHQFRFYDDFEINKYRSLLVSSDDCAQFQHRRKIQVEESEAKEIPVDIFEVRSSSPKRQPPAPPPPPPLPSVEFKQKPKREYRSVRSKEKREKARGCTDGDSSNIKRAPPPPAPPPPPPPPPPTPPPARITYESERKQRRSERRKSKATKEIKMVLASLYNQRKRKLHVSKNKSESHDNHKPSDSPEIEQTNYYSKIPPPSPPPPPPLPPRRPSQSIFHGFFKKGGKSKKVHSVPTPPPPPPPPPSARWSKRKIQVASSSAPPTPPPQPPTPATPPRRRPGRPPLPTRPTASYDENLNSGNQSPLIPRPPPPPPFKMPKMKFVFHGDFAKIRSNQSSRCSSPEREEIDLGLSIDEPGKVIGISPEGGVDGGVRGVGGPAFCPSPDVNIKADSFIARLKDEWRHEKMSSAGKKTGAGSGPFGSAT